MNWDWEKLKEQQKAKSPVPPQMDEYVKKIKKLKIPGGPVVLLVIAVLLFGSSMFYTIGVDEVGVVQRFGKYVRTSQPGLNFKLPAVIEKVTKVKVRRIYKEEFGFTSSVPGQRSRFLPGGNDNRNVSLMLTGDLNVAVVPWIVQYRIKDPYNYLFKVRDVRKLLIDMSEAA